MKIKVKKELLTKAINECKISDEEKKKLLIMISVTDEKEISIYSEDISISLLSYILQNGKGISSTLKAKLSESLIENNFIQENVIIDDIWNLKIKTLGDVVEYFSRIGTRNFNADILFNKKWYPVVIKPKFHPATRYNPAYVEIIVNVKIMKEIYNVGWKIYTEDLKDSFGKLRKPTLSELFSEYGARKQECNLNEFLQSVEKAKQIAKQDGKQILCNGYVLSIKNAYHNSFEFVSINIGNAERAIIEPELEYEDASARYREEKSINYTEFPFIRAFSLTSKKYILIDVEQTKKYIYDKNAINKLFLPQKITSILSKVFSASQDELYGDIVKHKHGGLIIMATGQPGIGKTSTAEVYSELKQIPLYSLDISELGTSAKNVEENLSIIFKRVEKWKAIILFDEVDIFLSKRNLSLERSAIVGIFLRLMDYFQGIMFFTTNRPEVLDYAIKSRITLSINYPQLDTSVREKIWNEKLTSAGIKINGNIDKLAKIDLNGREIRNTVRLVKIVLGSKTTQEKIIELYTSFNTEK